MICQANVFFFFFCLDAKEEEKIKAERLRGYSGKAVLVP